MAANVGNKEGIKFFAFKSLSKGFYIALKSLLRFFEEGKCKEDKPRTFEIYQALANDPKEEKKCKIIEI